MILTFLFLRLRLVITLTDLPRMLILQESPRTFKYIRHGCISRDTPQILQSKRSVAYESHPKPHKYKLSVFHVDTSNATKSTRSFCKRDSPEVYKHLLGVFESENPRVLHAHCQALIAKEQPSVQRLREPRAICFKEDGNVHRCPTSMSETRDSEVFQTTKSLFNREAPGVIKNNRTVNAQLKVGPFKSFSMHVEETPDVYKSSSSLNTAEQPGVFNSSKTLSVKEFGKSFRTTRSLSVDDKAGQMWSSRTFAKFERPAAFGKLNTVYEHNRTNVVSKVNTAYTFNENSAVTANPRTFSIREQQQDLGAPVTFAIRDKPMCLGQPTTFKFQEEAQQNVRMKTSVHRTEKIEVFYASNTAFSSVGVINDTTLRRLGSMSDDQALTTQFSTLAFPRENQQ